MNNKKNNKGSKMTIDKLAKIVVQGFKSSKKHTEGEIEKLAISTAQHFERLEAKIATKEGLKNLEEKVEKIDVKVEGLKNQIEGVNRRIDDISLNRVKYEDFNKLTVRVEKLEKAK